MYKTQAALIQDDESSSRRVSVTLKVKQRCSGTSRGSCFYRQTTDLYLLLFSISWCCHSLASRPKGAAEVISLVFTLGGWCVREAVTLVAVRERRNGSLEGIS